MLPISGIEGLDLDNGARIVIEAASQRHVEVEPRIDTQAFGTGNDGL